MSKMSRILIAMIRFYRKYISPMKRGCCIYIPTCSQYAESPKEVSFRLSNPNIGMPAFKKSSNEDGYILRLINNSEREQTATVTLNGAQIDLVFGKYEVKTLRYADGVFTALDRMEI